MDAKPTELQRLEQEVKLRELDVRTREADKAIEQVAVPWWRRADVGRSAGEVAFAATLIVGMP